MNKIEINKKFRENCHDKQTIVESYKALKESLCQITNQKRKELERAKKLEDRIELLNTKVRSANNEEQDKKMKLEQLYKIVPDHAEESLTKTGNILGYKVTKGSVVNGQGLHVVLHYNEFCFIKYIEMETDFELVEICPQHPNFDEIKQYLQRSKDFKGLLCTLRKYFDIATEFKQNCK